LQQKLFISGKHSSVYNKRVHCDLLFCLSEFEAVGRFALEALVGIEVLARGFDVAMPHEVLDGDDIGAGFQEPGGVRMPEFVEGRPADVSGFGDAFEATEQMRHPASLVSGKDPFRVVGEFLQQVNQIGRERDLTLLIIFRGEAFEGLGSDAERVRLQVEIGPLQKIELLFAKAGHEQGRKYGFIPFVAAT
jgi:hypothetical protein